jgi:hypothetical protein
MKNIVFILALMVLFLSCFLIFQPEIENNPKADLSEKLKSPKDSVLTSGRRTAIRRIKVNRSSLSVREELLSYYQSIMTNEKRMHIRDDIIIGIMCRMVSYDPFQALEIANDIEDKKRRENVKKEVVKYLVASPHGALDRICKK